MADTIKTENEEVITVTNVDTQPVDEGGKKWTEYITKTKPDDNDELMVLSTSEKANKRIRFSAVWDWIVDKLASAVVSKLTTTDKTVVGAINELNSNRASTLYDPSDTPNCNDFGMGLYLLCYAKNGIPDVNWQVIISINVPNAATGFQIGYDLICGKQYWRSNASGKWSDWRAY